MIDVLMGRSEGEHQFIIGLGAGLTCMNDWVDVLDTSQGIRRNWKKWQMLGFLMKKYFTEIPTYIV